ncbi:type III-B CRISPR module RAMP protein Cmr4 [Thermobifida halotolerans]|uniref:Type III-B CRISPR module RAMP protein Cmr4 n=1 Tax=Thermobifida halotolerans TaxID=483545 RepID=A0A399G5H7_9ACTN|nr:type III-B CRISPR module RAMP protein Cmr4 [Thermobifida halotolerans]UOE19087.1 type III-B CRISPR module RAMP protein Cmr4 [Thermobifida halotolerans]
MTELLAFFYTESPLHAGASDSLGVIDLPIQREAHTGYPVVWGQSLKGALRQAAQEHPDWNDADVAAVFGSEVSPGQATTPGLLAVGDAQLVALPVPTLHRTFAWVTSAVALGRLARKYRALGREPAPAVPDVSAEAVAVDAAWTGEQALGPVVARVVSEPAEQVERLRAWAAAVRADAFDADTAFEPFRAKFSRDLLLVDSQVMGVLVEECTEVTARVQLDDAKTVSHGPFHSEYLPTETVLAASLTLRPVRSGNGVDDAATRRHRDLVRGLLHGDGATLLRLGGDETLGKGLVWCRLAERRTTGAGGR